MTPTIRDATLADCHALAPILHKADLAEIAAGSGRPPLEALVDCFEGFAQRFTIEAGGVPFAIFGGAHLPWCSDCTVGSPWMLGSDALRDQATWFSRETPGIVERVLEEARGEVEAKDEEIGKLETKIEELEKEEDERQSEETETVLNALRDYLADLGYPASVHVSNISCPALRRLVEVAL